MNFLLLFLLLWPERAFSQDEAALLSSCKEADLMACEKLGAYYISKESWQNSHMIGEMLCGKDVPMGCTFAGTSLLAMKKVKEGTDFLNKACDRFEPHACRSMARLMKNSDQNLLSYIYFKRACQYGLRESCSVRKPQKLYSPHGEFFLKDIRTKCVDTTLSLCQDQLARLGKCEAPLTKEDCLILPGELSIYFRARLMQSEAGLSLTSILASQKLIKEAPDSSGYSYNLKEVLKNYSPLNSYNYVFGFMKACRKRFGKSSDVVTSLELFPESYKHLSARVRANILAYFSQGKQTDCYDPKGGFEAYAVGNLDEFNLRKLDVWKMNQDGNLMNVKDGLP